MRGRGGSPSWPRKTNMRPAKTNSPARNTTRRAAAKPAHHPAGLLQKDLHQSVPFASLHAEAFLNLLRTADHLQRRLRLTLKPYGITDTQYNVLRILRGAGAHPLPCSEIGERLISQVPDITRLLDRMERGGMIRRERDDQDRRMVLSRITPTGLGKLKDLDGVLERCVEKMLEHLTRQELLQMTALLEDARHPEVRKKKRDAKTATR